MLQFHLSILPFVVIAIVSFFLSWIWYSPVLLQKPWATALGTYGKKEMPFLFLSGFLAVWR